jgi:poly(3-hydroxyalkanoate) synthetase
VAAKHDVVSPAPGVFALCDAVGSSETTRITVPGGHVGSLVGRDANRTSHAPIVRWLDAHVAAQKSLGDL